MELETASLYGIKRLCLGRRHVSISTASVRTNVCLLSVGLTLLVVTRSARYHRLPSLEDLLHVRDNVSAATYALERGTTPLDRPDPIELLPSCQTTRSNLSLTYYWPSNDAYREGFMPALPMFGRVLGGSRKALADALR